MKQVLLLCGFLSIFSTISAINYSSISSSQESNEYLRTSSPAELNHYGAVLSCEMPPPPTTTELHPNYAGFGPVTDGVDGYDTNQNIGALWVTGATNWEFQFTDPFGNVISYITGNLNNNLNLNNVDEICYGTNYDVVVQPMVGGVWCGFGNSVNIIMEDYPTTKLQAGYCGATISSLIEYIYPVTVGNVEEYRYRLTTDNGATIFEYDTDFIGDFQLDQSPFTRYNKIYSVEVKAKVCGVWGPYDESCTIIIAPIPFTQLMPEFCDGEFVPQVEFQWIPGATEYWAKIYPTDPDNENLPALGTPVLYHISNPSVPFILLGSIGLEPGNAYAVAVKPFVGEQEGDYGQHCLIFYDYAPEAPNGPPELDGPYMDYEEEKDSETNDSKLTLYPNPNTGNNFFLSSTDELLGDVRIYNLTGELVFINRVLLQEGQNEISLNKVLDPGIYTLFFSDGIDVQQGIKFIVKN